MAIYKNLTSATTHDLISKNKKGGDIQKISITNYSGSNAATVSIFIEDAAASESTDASNNKYYFISTLVIPVGTSFVLEDVLSFNTSIYHLRALIAGTSPLISVIIK
tara:strand:+ start:282 stop:602 length:321 start_codon:yes stop_codon:yes gene_type:complete